MFSSKVPLIDVFNKKFSQTPKSLALSLSQEKLKTFFSADEMKNTKLPLPELLKINTCTKLNEKVINTLNSLGRKTVSIGTISLDYNLPIPSGVRTLLGLEIKKNDGRVNSILKPYPLTNLDHKLLNNNVDYGLFNITLFLNNKEGVTIAGHKVSGYIDKNQKKIIIYDGASWINYDSGIQTLEEFFKKILPDYNLEIQAKCHQIYGTCSMFQPTVVYLMLLFSKEDILTLLDILSLIDGEDAETIVDNAVIDLFNYNPMNLEDKPVQHSIELDISKEDKLTDKPSKDKIKPPSRDVFFQSSECLQDLINRRLDQDKTLTPYSCGRANLKSQSVVYYILKKYLTIDEAIKLTYLNRVNLENKSVQHFIESGKLKFEDALKLTFEQRLNLEDKSVQNFIESGKLKFEDALKLTFKQRSNLECELTTGLEFPSQQFKR